MIQLEVIIYKTKLLLRLYRIVLISSPSKQHINLYEKGRVLLNQTMIEVSATITKFDGSKFQSFGYHYRRTSLVTQAPPVAIDYRFDLKFIDEYGSLSPLESLVVYMYASSTYVLGSLSYISYLCTSFLEFQSIASI